MRPNICLEGLGKARRTSINMAGVPIKIPTGHPGNAKRNKCRSSQLAGTMRLRTCDPTCTVIEDCPPTLFGCKSLVCLIIGSFYSSGLYVGSLTPRKEHRLGPKSTTPCSLVDGYGRFRRVDYLDFQDRRVRQRGSSLLFVACLTKTSTP